VLALFASAGHTNMMVAGRMLCCGKNKVLIYNKTKKIQQQ
jgi:hypothetical protein